MYTRKVYFRLRTLWLPDIPFFERDIYIDMNAKLPEFTISFTRPIFLHFIEPVSRDWLQEHLTPVQIECYLQAPSPQHPKDLR